MSHLKAFCFCTFTWKPNLSYCSISLTSGIWSTNILGEFFLHFEMSHFENTFSSSCHEQLSWSHFENTFSNSWGCCVVSGKRARLFSSEVYEKPSGIYIIHYISYIMHDIQLFDFFFIHISYSNLNALNFNLNVGKTFLQFHIFSNFFCASVKQYVRYMQSGSNSLP